MKVLLETRGAH